MKIFVINLLFILLNIITRIKSDEIMKNSVNYAKSLIEKTNQIDEEYDEFED
jgi:hypothetical protein